MNNAASNVTPITAAQPQAVAKFSIACQIDGFQVQVEVEGKADSLRAMIDRLKAIGATGAALPTGNSEPTKAAGVPTCPTHNATMKPSQKPGVFFCPKKNEDGSYCRHKA